MVPAVSKLDFLCHRVAAQLSVINTFWVCCPVMYHDKHPDYPLIQKTRLSNAHIKKKIVLLRTHFDPNEATLQV